MAIPAPLQLDAQGRIVCTDGFFTIVWENPWPSPNGRFGFVEPARGYCLHTEVGYTHSVVVEFENPSAQASAFCSISGGFGGDVPDGHIEQYGPIGHGWEAWTQAAGNPYWRGHENEDGGDPTHPLTDRQLWANAALFELESRVDGFPLQPTDDPVNGRGLIFHSDGGAAWGGHDCPGDVRRAQRPEIIARAIEIRTQAPITPGGGTVAFGLFRCLPDPRSPITPEDKGRIPFWGIDHKGNVYALNGARSMTGLGTIAPGHSDICEAIYYAAGDVECPVPGRPECVLLFADDGHQEGAAWNASTFVLTPGR